MCWLIKCCKSLYIESMVQKSETALFFQTAPSLLSHCPHSGREMLTTAATDNLSASDYNQRWKNQTQREHTQLVHVLSRLTHSSLFHLYTLLLLSSKLLAITVKATSSEFTSVIQISLHLCQWRWNSVPRRCRSQRENGRHTYARPPFPAWPQ